MSDLQQAVRLFTAQGDSADARIWPAYDEYQTKTSRDIPVVILEPAG